MSFYPEKRPKIETGYILLYAYAWDFVFILSTNYRTVTLVRRMKTDVMRNNIAIDSCETSCHSIPLVVTPLIFS
jgi:hypothetical protein